MKQRTISAALMLGLVLSAGCTDFSPWPPAGGKKDTTVHERKARPLPAGEGEGATKSLLAASLEQQGVPNGDGVAQLGLPRQAKALVFAALQRAAKDDLEGLLDVLSVDATYGLPATSELESKFVHQDPERFMDVLRGVGARLPANAAYQCAPIMPPALETYVRTGAEPMWCFFTSGDRLDLLAFKLRVEQGRAKIAYVGMFENKPERPVMAGSTEPPPPPVPPRDMTATNDDYTFKSFEPVRPEPKPAKAAK